MLNYERILVVVTYCIEFEGLIQLDAEAPTFYQVRPVAQTPIIAASVALREPILVGRYFLCS